MNFFERLQLREWRQFGEIDIDLSKQLTILTGQNGTGKTTILNTLSKHFGWNINLVATPYYETKKGKRIWSDFLRQKELDLDESDKSLHSIGSIQYDNGAVCGLNSKAIVSAQYNLKFSNQQPVAGLHIPSHRPASSYHSIPTIPTNPTSIQKHYQDFVNLLQQTYGSGQVVRNPGVIQKESLIALAVFGYGNEVVAPNLEFRRIFEKFQEVLRIVLPPAIGFQRLEVRMPEVVLVTKTGDFAIDAMSGGISALLSTAWQIHMYSVNQLDTKFTIIVDEPENHLHPSMQRSLLPSLARAFPNHRFIIATHSPFIVTSFPSAAVYGLLFEENRVFSRRLSQGELSGTPDKVLREILDVPSNLPIWVEQEIHRLIQEYDNLPVKEAADLIMGYLEEVGIASNLKDYGSEETT